MTNSNTEIRSSSTAASKLTIRTAADGKQTISGYAIVYDKPTNLGEFWEVCRFGCLKDTFRDNPDILLLRDHKQELLLGRTGVNLTLRDDPTGLWFEADLLPTQTAQDAYKDISAGLLSGCSFGFVVDQDAWSYSNGKVLRELLAISLAEISCTSFPAYTSTSVEATRSAQSFTRSREDDEDDDEDEDDEDKRESLGDEDQQQAYECCCRCSRCSTDNCEGCDDDECDDDECYRALCPMQDLKRADAIRIRRLFAALS